MATTWRVTNQREEDELTEQGSFSKTIVVTFEVIPTGMRASVKVSAREYTEDRVRQLIDEYAKRLIKVSEL